MNLPRPAPSAPSQSEPLLTSSGENRPTVSLSPAPHDPDGADLGRLGKYRLCKELGRGGMGVVYLAYDERLQRQVALKVMLPRVAADATARERFLREARAAARISSDHVVSVFEADEIDGTPCIAMQYLEGCSLAQHLARQGPLAISEVMRIGREAALGLAAAHRLGLVHRDIKPGNLWLEGATAARCPASATGGRVKVLDFGLARPILDESGAELTGSGAVVGTPAYMAPEQGMAQPLDGRADLFSLGCVLYRLCTGKLPFDRPSLMATLTAIATEEPTPVQKLNPDVPEALADLIHRLLAKKPEDRPAGASAVAGELARLLAAATGTPELSTTVDYAPALVPKRRWRAAAWAALALLPLLALGAWLVIRPTAPASAPLPAPAGPIKGSVDLLVYRIDGTGSDVLVPLSHPLAMPLRTGDEFKIVAEVDRPAYLYLFWVDENGAGVPVYPWQVGKWGTRPADERPVAALELLAPNGKGFAITGDAKGMETIVMLARSERLAVSDAEVQGWFAGLKPLPFRGAQARVWFENFDVLRTDEKRGLKYGGDLSEVGGPRRLQLALKQKVGPVELARAISFARVGRQP